MSLLCLGGHSGFIQKGINTPNRFALLARGLIQLHLMPGLAMDNCSWSMGTIRWLLVFAGLSAWALGNKLIWGRQTCLCKHEVAEAAEEQAKLDLLIWDGKS